MPKISRLSFLLSVLIVGILFSILSENVTFGPSWVILVIAIILFLPLSLAILKNHQIWVRRIALTIMGIITVGLISSVVFLVISLFVHKTDAAHLFQDAAILWVANIAVFAVWYWEVDQGGPLTRHMNKMEPKDFLFPQMISDNPLWSGWKPGYMDYLFLAFNTSTAFSPTDTMVMSKKAKFLMMTQGSISLIIVAVLAARAINIA